MSLVLAEVLRPSGAKEIALLREEIIAAKKRGEWRSVIILHNPHGDVMGMHFPPDCLRLRREEDMTAAGYIQLFDNISGIDRERTMFAFLGYDEDGKLAVHSAIDRYSKGVDANYVNQLVQDYLYPPANT